MNIGIMSKVEKVGARTEKEKLLATVDDGTKRFLKIVSDPYVTLGVTLSDERFDLLVASRTGGSEEAAFWDALHELCGKLAKRELTGHAAAEAIDSVLLVAPSTAHLLWGSRVINQDLRIGVATKTMLKIFPGLVEPFQVQLAHPYEPGKHEISGRWAVEPKLDGLRLVRLDGKMFTRNGKEVTSCQHILDQLEEGGVNNDWVLDGEVMGEVFDEASGQVRKNEACTSLIYHVFDCITRAAWAAKSTPNFGARRMDLEDLGLDALANVKTVPHKALPPNPSAEEIFKIRDEMLALGYEGSMLKNLAAPYQFKRTNDLLKVKDFKDADGTVVGTYPGKGKYKGKLGGLIVAFQVPNVQADDSGTQVNDESLPSRIVTTEVGSGFTDAMRSLPIESWISKVVEVQYQNMTPDGKLRFPVFIRERSDKA